MTTYQILLIALAILQVGDYMTTSKIIKQGGRELNPVMKKIIDVLGIKPAFFVKGVVTVLIGSMLTPTFLAVVCAIYAVVVFLNWSQIK